MTVAAYILVQTEVAQSAEVARRARDVEGVQSADQTTGPYDVIVRAEAQDINELGRMVVSSIQAIDGIQRTLTCPVVDL